MAVKILEKTNGARNDYVVYLEKQVKSRKVNNSRTSKCGSPSDVKRRDNHWPILRLALYMESLDSREAKVRY